MCLKEVGVVRSVMKGVKRGFIEVGGYFFEVVKDEKEFVV